MKKNLLSCIQLICLLSFVSIINFQCKKQSSDKFCELQRTVSLTVVNKEGMIVYSNKHNRYAVSLTLTTSSNIDSQVIGFICELKDELKVIGLRVTVSGVLKTFNADEKMTPEIAGQDLYFLEISQIAKSF